ncbi:MAG: hypothetical protein LAN64_06875 [Acidobacteriia bacterium]|nr:hypothetical protein [Terriglobia bacterium]
MSKLSAMDAAQIAKNYFNETVGKRWGVTVEEAEAKNGDWTVVVSYFEDVFSPTKNFKVITIDAASRSVKSMKTRKADS